ncbi:uncharacterized protein LOC119292007 isoform X2 [Triticum dicoccoides]|uniref:uncharacterized protein LOC119292007 isoform X2 n=1 Tax=Triticum dicoccoides TaxID=85692 RepID=UPI0018904B42|nr:uncharacterized protein LOC119292007 isoform X2 [Triticum dicoccoides]
MTKKSISWYFKVYTALHDKERKEKNGSEDQKDDVAAGKIGPPSKDNGGEVHEQGHDTRSVEKVQGIFSINPENDQEEHLLVLQSLYRTSRQGKKREEWL